MIDEKLMRRISDAVSSQGGIAADTELRGLLEVNPQARAYADDLSALDDVMRAWPEPTRADDDWDTGATRVMERLDGAAKFLGDMTQPPRFDDPYATPPPAGSEFDIGNLSELEVKNSLKPASRTSAPPLPMPTGERALIPQGVPLPLGHGFQMPTEPVAVAASVAERADEPVVSKKPKGAIFAAAAVVLLALVGGGLYVRSEQRAAVARAEAARVATEELEAKEAAELKLQEAEQAKEAAAKADEARKLAEATKLAAAAEASAEEDAEDDDTTVSKGRKGKKKAGKKTTKKVAAAAPAAAGLSDTPGRADVIAAMKGVEGRVMACRKGRHGVLNAKIGVSGKTGKVQSVQVLGSFAGSPEGDCAMRAVRAAHFPKFKKAEFSFQYPFRF